MRQHCVFRLLLGSRTRGHYAPGRYCAFEVWTCLEKAGYWYRKDRMRKGKGRGPGFMRHMYYYVLIPWATPMVILRADDINAWIAVLANG